MSFIKKFNSGVASAFGSVGGLLNAITGVTEQQDRTYEQQKKAMEAQNAYNTYMYNLSNQYNTPAAQLARMAEAGIEINPTAYALGSGNLSNTASTVSSASGFQGSGSPAGNPITSLMGVAQGIQGLKNAKADYQLKQETQDRTALETDIMRHNLKYGQDHNLPVGSMPGIDATLASFVNRGLTDASKGGSMTSNKPFGWLGKFAERFNNDFSKWFK